ncbi:outer membrane protein assembly factor BamD [Ottowia thiooxydans]|uniref:outer membrane protein assembly factor BamD n=1 Tax=Ottowia thiooxydans TaxID=219182 RepID=UPI0004106928|nr:outer membrane protein assembly factor BamD [Ottowia thiooxydans]
MHRARLSAAASGVLALALLLAACSSKPIDQTAGWSPNRIHAEAKDEMNSGGFDKAIPLFERLEGRAAGTPLAQQAQLEKAYSQYKGGERAEALNTLDRFMRLHPASPAIDYALYMKGVINFNDELGLFSFLSRQDLSERDQRAAKEAFESFKELVTRYPDSRYTPDARARMTYTVNALAQYEVHVARYYYNRSAYVAAINRAQQAISDYRDAPALEEGLYIILQSYEKLGMTQLRDDTQRVLEKTYPNSEYVARGFKPKSSPWWQLW